MQVDSGACRGHGIWWNIAGFVGSGLNRTARFLDPTEEEWGGYFAMGELFSVASRL